MAINVSWLWLAVWVYLVIGAVIGSGFIRHDARPLWVIFNYLLMSLLWLPVAILGVISGIIAFAKEE